MLSNMTNPHETIVSIDKKNTKFIFVDEKKKSQGSKVDFFSL